MKTPTIENFLEAFLNPAGRFQTLKEVVLLRDATGEPLYAAHSKSVDFAITHQGQAAAACCPVGRGNPFELRDTVQNRYKGDPTLLINEMLVFNDRDESRRSDVWLVELPDTAAFQKKMPKENTPVKSAYTLKTPYCEGLAAAKQGRKYGYVDRTGKTVVPFRYDWADAFDEGLALVKQGDLFGLIDKTGREILVPEYEDIRWRSANGVIPVCCENGAWKLHDRQGNIISPNAYDFIYDFSCGLASVRREMKYGYIDRNGEVAIPLIYDEAYSFSEEGLATVVRNGVTFMIDTEGRIFD